MIRRSMSIQIRFPSARRGITLTEILISILIMGIGMLSLATLFPLGLLRLRAANRATRSAYIALSASSDVSARNMLSLGSFESVPWYFNNDTPPVYISPMVNDGLPSDGKAFSVNFGPGLPIVYDPLWRAVTNNYSQDSTTRFGCGIGPFFGDDTSNANGIQRITNFTAKDADAVVAAFVSPEDVVFQDPKATSYVDPNTGGLLSNPSPVVPDLSLVVDLTNGPPVSLPNITPKINYPQLDWRYSWIFTGRQTDRTNSTVFDGYIVVFENRQFGLDPVPGTTTSAPTGETTVEAVWGPPRSGKRTVVLRWSASLPDPEIKVGQWIADVTYGRRTQRCYWYQIGKRTEPQPNGNYREATVWVNSDLIARTPLDNNGVPFVEAALICPSVINVIPRTIMTH